MANKPRKLGRMAPLQELELVPITDPAKIAALEEQRRQAKHATASQVLELSRQLPPEERFLLLTQLTDDLPPDKQLALVQHFRARLAH